MDKFLKGPNGKAVFDTIREGLESFSGWINKPQFQEDLKSFSTAVTEIVRAIGRAVIWIGGMVGGKDELLINQIRDKAFAAQQNPNNLRRPSSSFSQDNSAPHDSDPSALGFVKALGKTALGLLTGVGVDDVEERWKAGGWYSHQLAQEPEQKAQRAKKPAGIVGGGHLGDSDSIFIFFHLLPYCCLPFLLLGGHVIAQGNTGRKLFYSLTRTGQ